MEKREFEILLGKEVAPEEYEIIETVYSWYDENITKNDIKDLYLKYGIKIIEDMYGRAKQIEEVTAAIEEEKKRHNEEMERLLDNLTLLRKEE